MVLRECRCLAARRAMLGWMMATEFGRGGATAAGKMVEACTRRPEKRDLGFADQAPTSDAETGWVSRTWSDDDECERCIHQ